MAFFLKYVDLYLKSEWGRFYVGHPVFPANSSLGLLVNTNYIPVTLRDRKYIVVFLRVFHLQTFIIMNFLRLHTHYRIESDAKVVSTRNPIAAGLVIIGPDVIASLKHKN
jgi:hypothetical protein